MWMSFEGRSQKMMQLEVNHSFLACLQASTPQVQWPGSLPWPMVTSRPFLFPMSGNNVGSCTFENAVRFSTFAPKPIEMTRGLHMTVTFPGFLEMCTVIDVFFLWLCRLMIAVNVHKVLWVVAAIKKSPDPFFVEQCWGSKLESENWRQFFKLE